MNICLVLDNGHLTLDRPHNFCIFVFVFSESLHLSRLRASPLPSWFTGDEQARNSLQLEPPRSFEEDPESFEGKPGSFEEDPGSLEDWPRSLLMEEQLVAEEASSTLAGETPPGL